MSTKKPAVKKPKTQVSKPEEPQPESQPEIPPESATSTTEPPVVVTLESLQQEVESLKLTVAELQETLARKRKPPASNGKMQILDKQTGEIYRSKNNAYQTLLKSGTLKELVDKGVFGDIPKKNTFGWYALVRELPNRFEEVKPEEDVQQ